MASHNQELSELQVQNIREKASKMTASAEKAYIDMHDIRHRLQTIATLVEICKKIFFITLRQKKAGSH